MTHSFSKFALTTAIVLALPNACIYAAEQTPPQAAGQSISDEVGNARREAQIWTSYAFNPHLKALDISVKVQGNRAILSGAVENDIEKDLAEQIALGVDGIKNVDNKIQVEANYEAPKRNATEPSFSDKVNDATITASVKSKLLWNSNTDGLDIHVETTNGRVTLTGNTETAAQKDLAGHIAQNTDDVVGVKNQIATANASDAKPQSETRSSTHKTDNPVSDGWITTKVKSTLLLSRNVHGLDITVNTNDGVVALMGVVPSASERDLAIALAKDIRGVKRVDASALKVQ